VGEEVLRSYGRKMMGEANKGVKSFKEKEDEEQFYSLQLRGKQGGSAFGRREGKRLTLEKREHERTVEPAC